jgi:hypothetical protein
VTNRLLRQEFAPNSRGTVGNVGFYGGTCQWVIRRTTGARIRSWKGATIPRGIESGGRGIAIVGAITRQLLVKRLHAGKGLARALVICIVWK